MNRAGHTNCIECGKPHQREHAAMRCWPCSRAVVNFRAKAYHAVMKAVRLGELPPARSLACVDCGKPARDYDHRDYRRLLDVVPTCRSCNLLRGAATWRDVVASA